MSAGYMPLQISLVSGIEIIKAIAAIDHDTWPIRINGEQLLSLD